MPSDETRRVLDGFVGAALTSLEAAIDGRKPFDEIMELDAELARRTREMLALVDRLRSRRSGVTAARVDASGVALSLPRPPRRIVSLIPSITETLCRLGLADALVGITVYCVEPRDVVRDKTRIGGEKDPDLDKIRALAARPGHRQHRGERPRARRHAARLGHPGVGDLSAHGGRVAGHDPRAGRGDRHRRPRRRACWPTSSRSTRACGRRPPARRPGAGLLPDLARAVDDDQRRHLHPRPAGRVRRGQRVRRPARALSDGDARRDGGAPAGGHPAARRAVPLPPRPPRGFRAVSPTCRRCGTAASTSSTASRSPGTGRGWATRCARCQRCSETADG